MDTRLLGLIIRGMVLSLRSLLHGMRRGPIILTGVSAPSGGHPRGRALLIYVLDAFSPSHGLNRKSGHQNVERALIIAEQLAECGYVVDAARHTAGSIELSQEYDLIVGLGPTMLTLDEQIRRTTRTLFIMTGAAPSRNNAAEVRRLNELEMRRGVRLKPRRLANWPDEALTSFGAVAYIGNDWTRAGIEPFNARLFPYPSHRCPPTPPLTPRPVDARKHFLFIASGGQVHRGLDVLLEAFAQQPDSHLHICSPLHAELDFVWHYRHELFACANIHPWGWTRTDSDAFRRIANRCAYVILPSCAEGQPGAVTLAMHWGLIPIVSRECGFNLDGLGCVLPDCSTKTIKEIIRSSTAATPEDVAAESQKVVMYAERNFGVDTLRKRWLEILKDVIEDCGGEPE